MAVEYKDYKELDFKIDAEFQAKIPKMPDDAMQGLRSDIISDGYIRDALVIWKEENTLLDGHHRWEIKKSALDKISDSIPVEYRSFDDRWAAIVWICRNQLHKHNMNKAQRDKLIQEEHDARQKMVGAPIGNKNAQKQLGENHPIVSESQKTRTRLEIAKEHQITESSVKAAVEAGRAIDNIDKVLPGFKDKVMSGEIHYSRNQLGKLRNLDPEPLKQSAESYMRGERPSAMTDNSPQKKPRKQRQEDSTTSPSPSTEQYWNDPSKSDSRGSGKRPENPYDFAPTKYSLDSLLEEITENGEDYISGLQRHIDVMFPQFEGIDGAKDRVRKAIDGVIAGLSRITIGKEDLHNGADEHSGH